MDSTDEPANTVLVVDDNPQLLAFITDTLEELGSYAVLTAADGVQGLERCYEARPDCVVIDVRMPGLNGYQLVRALRGDPDSAGIPLVMLSALAQDKEQLAGLLAGADQYLIKPVEPLDLVQAIRHAIQLSVEDRVLRRNALMDTGEVGE